MSPFSSDFKVIFLSFLSFVTIRLSAHTLILLCLLIFSLFISLTILLFCFRKSNKVDLTRSVLLPLLILENCSIFLILF
jgi:hypothetical protein